MVNLRDGATARYDAMRQAMDGGWKRVDAFDFYASMFPEGTLDTAEAWASRSGQDGRVHGRAIMLRLNAGVAETSVQVRTDPTVRRVFVCDGLDGLLASSVEAGVFVMAPISYWGASRELRFAHSLRALAIDLDDPILDTQGRPALLAMAQQGRIPVPTFTVLSGTGLHLYYVFDEPLDMRPATRRAAQALKHALVEQTWTPETSHRPAAQFEGIDQAFRVVGSHANLDDAQGDPGEWRTVTAWRTGTTLGVQALVDAIADPKRREDVARLFKPRMPWHEAAAKYPDWAERVSLHGEPKAWPARRSLYEWWKRQAGKASEGHRYHYLMALAIYGIKCAVPRPQVRGDMIELLPQLSAKGAPMGQVDVDDALQAYDPRYLAYGRQAIQELTGIRIEARKRNGRSRAEHLAWARSIQAAKDPEGTWRGGKPSKQKEVTAWVQAHPDATQAQCAKALGVSPSTVHKYWKHQDRDRPSPKARLVRDYIRRHPEATAAQVAQATGVSRPTAYKYMKD